MRNPTILDRSTITSKVIVYVSGIPVTNIIVLHHCVFDEVVMVSLLLGKLLCNL
jgi:hypothetical protein